MTGSGKVYIAALCLALVVCLSGPALAAPAVRLSSIEVERGYSRLIDLDRPLKRVSVADQKIADVLVISPRQLYVNGLGVGATNLTVWDRHEKVMASIDIRVHRNLTRLKKSLAQLFPAEKIEVRELEGAVILSGSVSSPEAKAKAESVARAFEKDKDRVSNLIDVVGHKQVKLKLTFAEVNRNALKRMTVNIGYFDAGGAFLFTFLNGLTTPDETSTGLGDFNITQKYSQGLGAMGGFSTGGARFMGFLDILKENGLAKVLAEPTLVCLSGQKADFLAGGEFPIPVPGQNYTTIEFKKYGVQLEFTPQILNDGRIRLKVTPEVSDLDYSNAVVTSGFTIPGLTTRRASTQLVLKDGQGFAIAGLFKRDVSQTVAKWPLLGDIPIIGVLFRSRAFQQRETDLVIAVTPMLVQADEDTMPNINREPVKMPGDWDFYMGNKELPDWTLEKQSGPLAAQKGGKSGNSSRFGYDLTF